MDKPKCYGDFVSICNRFEIDPYREYFDIYSVGDALWKAYKLGVEKTSQLPESADKSIKMDYAESRIHRWQNILADLIHDR